MTAAEPLEPSAAFAELGRIKLSETSLDQVLHRIAELANAPCRARAKCP